MAKEKQKKLIKKIVENGGKQRKSMGRLMVEVGYSPAYAKNPAHLRGTKTWQELMEIYLSDKEISKKHFELLNACAIQHYIFPRLKEKLITKKGKVKHLGRFLDNKIIKEIVESVPGCKLIYVKRDDYTGSMAFFQAPDNRSRRDALDMAYKLGGKYAPDQIELVKRKYEDMSNAELAAKIKVLKDFLLKR